MNSSFLSMASRARGGFRRGIRVRVTDLEAVKALLTRNPIYEACGTLEIVSYLVKPGRFSCWNALNQGSMALRSW